MLEYRRFTDTEQKKLIETMVILCDTREHEGKNDHILQWFDKSGIAYKKTKLDFGDYSFMLPSNEELKIPYDIYFDKKVIVERKANLEELSNNYVERKRIKNEFAYAPESKVLLVENASYAQMVEGGYKTELNPKAFWATMLSMWHEYGIPVFFMPDKKYSGQFIYGYLKYYLHNVLKRRI